MRISFKSFLGETFMLFPNINFWSDDDPEYAPHKYMIFFGWLFWGVRIYFGRREEKGAYRVRIIYNEALDKSYYVIAPTNSDSMLQVVRRSCLYSSVKDIVQTDEQKKALDGCEELFVDNLRHIAVFSAIEDAFTLRDMLNAISASAAQKPDRWVFLPKYCRMYINRYGI